MMAALGWTLMVAGAGVSLVAAAGLHRRVDSFARMHIAGLMVTVGVVPIMLGSALIVGGAGAAKLVLAAVFLLVTSPAATGALASATWGAESQTDPQTVHVGTGKGAPDPNP